MPFHLPQGKYSIHRELNLRGICGYFWVEHQDKHHINHSEMIYLREF